MWNYGRSIFWTSSIHSSKHFQSLVPFTFPTLCFHTFLYHNVSTSNPCFLVFTCFSQLFFLNIAPTHLAVNTHTLILRTQHHILSFKFTITNSLPIKMISAILSPYRDIQSTPKPSHSKIGRKKHSYITRTNENKCINAAALWGRPCDRVRHVLLQTK